jgi:hypothetical protein
MDRQLFATGQIVRVAEDSLSGPSTADDFKIVRRYRVTDLPDLYRIQSMADPSERMVPVGELSATIPSLASHRYRPSNIVALFGSTAPEPFHRTATT